MFKKIQDEINLLLTCERHADVEFPEPGIKKHKIIQRMLVSSHQRKDIVYTVEYRPDGQYFSCNCKKFESKGIPYCHIFKLMSWKDIDVINERYIMRRWRKDVYRPHSKLFLVGGYPQMTEDFKNFNILERSLEEAFVLVGNNTQRFNFIKEGLEAMKADLKDRNDGLHVSDGYHEDESSTQNRIRILDPRVMRGRGRPPINRQKSRFEQLRHNYFNRGRATNRGRGGNRRSSNRSGRHRKRNS